MTPSREESELPKEVPPVVKSRLSSVIVLSMALGALLALFLVYFYYSSQQVAALQSEVAIAREALKEKTKSVEDVRRQIEALSRQLDALKEYSIARSAISPSPKGEQTAPASGVEAATSESSLAGQEKAAKPALASKAKASKRGNGANEVTSASSSNPSSATNTLDCNLVGKSAREQEATMKRCVELSNTGGGEQ